MQKCISDLCSHYFIDEAHHTTAQTWTEFIQRFSNSSVLQFTATPFRNDGSKLNGEIIYNYPLRMAQEEHYFTNISFSPIFEINSEKSDIEIAKAAISILKQRKTDGYTKQIVQPGLSVNSITLEQRTLLAVTEQYLMDVSNIPLCVIANKD